MLEAVAIIVTGGLAGWIAARLMSGAGYGLVVNVIVGIIGGVIGGKLFAVLQIPVGSWLSSWPWRCSARSCCSASSTCCGHGPIDVARTV
jgi:uncharacterized membrane protein YeaQ/YmgE (transglycosylase-associated protein family)